MPETEPLIADRGGAAQPPAAPRVALWAAAGVAIGAVVWCFQAFLSGTGPAGLGAGDQGPDVRAAPAGADRPQAEPGADPRDDRAP
ncbi:MAG: hypothetical protein HY719_14615 [Planctomycetes bacterium]|nr:hypothetical protein [Planctomycetota bacterium]